MPRLHPAALASALSFILAFSVMAADLAWNVEATLTVEGDAIPLGAQDRYAIASAAVPNRTLNMTLTLVNDRPLPFDDRVRVGTEGVYTDRGGPESDAVLDERVDIAPGEAAELTFQVTPSELANTGGAPTPEKQPVRFFTLVVEWGAETHTVHFTVQEDSQ